MLFLNLKLSDFKRIALYSAVLIAFAVLALIAIVKTKNIEERATYEEEIFSPASYITSFGVAIDESALRVDEIKVPTEFGEVYTSYNNLQKSQGFNLEKYKGKTLERYTYPVTNYPDKSQSVFVEVLVLDGVIVAADVYSTDMGGFMSPLK